MEESEKSIYLKPFTLKETKEYLSVIKKVNYTEKQVLDIYMILGGIPYCLDMLDTSKPISINIDNLFFARNGHLRIEFNFLFRSLFKETENYKKVILTLSKRLVGLTRDDIIKETKLSGGALTDILNNLRACDFIRCYSSYGKKEKEKLFQLIDPHTLFYLRFIDNDDGQNESFWTNNYGKPIINVWTGYAFEVICLNHINQIKRALRISGINSNVSSKKINPHIDKQGNSWPGAQIDLLIDRDDNVINVIEIKYSNDEYIITSDYAKILNNLLENFKNTTNTKKALINTMITSCGLKINTQSNTIIFRY